MYKQTHKLSDWVRPQFSAVVSVRYLRRSSANTTWGASIMQLLYHIKHGLSL